MKKTFLSPLFVKLFFSFFIFSILPTVIVGFTIYYNTLSGLDERLKFEADLIFNQHMKTLSLYADDLNQMIDSINNSIVVSSFLKSKSSSEAWSYYLELDKLIRSVNAIRPENQGITLINDKGYVYYYGYSLNRNEANFSAYNWLPKDLSPVIGAFTPVHTRPYSYFDSEKPVYSFVRQIYSYDLKYTGLCIIDFDVSDLDALFQSQLNQYFEDQVIKLDVTDQNGQYLYRSHQIGDLDEYERIVQYDDKTGWTMSAYFKKDQFYEPISNISKITIFTVFLSTLLCLLLSFIISRFFSKPIKKLQSLMKRVEEGDLDVCFKVQSHDEIGELGRGFNHMVRNIKELMHRVYEEQNLKRKAEISALQAQINPHFIYNTLESINALARKKKEHEISKMIVLLGKLLRSNISISEDFIPFAQELNNIEAFLEIHQLRRNKPFIYSINVAKEIYEYYTIKWILQPIVENAIIHGLGGKQDIGEIKVFGWVEKGDVYIQVSDRGAGMAYENLIQMRNHLEINYKEITRKDKHIGLVNVHSRIRSYFGHNYGITIDSKRGEGTTVTIKLPKLQKEEIYK